MPLLLQVSLQLPSFTMANLYGPYGGIISFLELDRPIAYIFAYVKASTPNGNVTSAHADRQIHSNGGLIGLPSISFQAFKKSSGSENATNPYFA